MKISPNHGSSLNLMTLRKAKWKILSALIMVSLMIFLNVSTAKAVLPIEVADGYELELVAPGLEIKPTNIAFDRKGKNLYVLYESGRIAVLDLDTSGYSDIVPPGSFLGSLGIAVHPRSGKLYVSSRYVIPAGDANLPDDVRSRISIVNPSTGVITTFVEGLPSMWFGDSVATGSQGIEFDSYGNLYVAQSVNDASRDGGDPNQSAILKIDKYGSISVFASGLRAPYDVKVAKENMYGKATILYTSDNGEGDDCNQCPDGQSSRGYYDELNRITEGKHYGWPAGAPGYPAESHIGPLWNFDRVLPDFESIFFPVWNVPTGIDILHGRWGKKVMNPLFLAMIRLSFIPSFPDQGVIEMFTGKDYSERITLAKYIDGPIDVRVCSCKYKRHWGGYKYKHHWGGSQCNKLYFAEYLTGDIYSIIPE